MWRVSIPTNQISHFCRYVAENKLRASVQGTLTGERAREIELHVRSCPRCASEIARIAAGELDLVTACAEQRTASRRRRSLTYLMIAVAAGIGMAFLLRELVG